VVTVQIPNDWPTKQQGEFLESSTPDGNCRLMLFPAEGSEVGESIAEAIRYIRWNGAITVRPGAPKKEKSTFKGRDMTMMSWQASAGGKPIPIRCYIVPIGRVDSFIVWCGAVLRRKTDMATRSTRSLGAS
jgi:hypothetical protein